ncbi:MAG: diguanylate cyclase, partial [Polyangiales bacterium]
MLTRLEWVGLAAICALVGLACLALVRHLRHLQLQQRRAREEREDLGSALAASEAVSAALSEEALFLSAVLSGVDVAIILADRAGRVRFTNQRFDEIFGIRSTDVVGRSRSDLREMISTCFADATAFAAADAAIDEARPSDLAGTRPSFLPGLGTHSVSDPMDEQEFVIERPRRRVLLWSARPVIQGDRRVGSLAVFRDVTRQRNAEQARERLVQELAAQARTDALTGLANRRQATETLAIEIERARRYNRPLGVVLFDLDHFKRVNDVFGHEAGDAVLRAFGDVLRASARGTDVVARWGGEEFLAILHEATLDATVAFAERVRTALAAISPLAPFVEGPAPPPVTVSAGATTLSHVGAEDADTLVRRADEALYAAKGSGRNRVAPARSPSM